MTTAEIFYEPVVETEMEQVVLGMAMSPKRNEVMQIVPMLSADLFFDTFHREIYSVLVEFVAKGVDCSSHVVGMEIERRNEKSIIKPHPNPVAYVNGLRSVGYIPSLAEMYVGMLVNASEKRRVAEVLTKGLRQITGNPDAQAHEVAGELMGDLIKDATGARALTVSLVDSLPQVMDTVRAKMMDPTLVFGLPCGWDFIDKSLGGFEKTKVYTLVAETGSGKSYTILWLAWQIAKFGGVPLIISTEMPPEEIYERLVFMAAGINFEAVKARSYSTEDEDASLNRAEAELADLRFYSAGVGGMEIGALEQEVIRQQSMNGIDIVFIDVLQHLTARGVRADNQVARLEVITARLKQMAMNRALPVVEVSHIPRSVAGGVPGLHSGKGGGSIEQDANVHISATAVHSNGNGWEPFASEQELNDYKNQHGKIAVMFRVNKHRSGTLPWEVRWLDWNVGGRLVPVAY